MNFYGLMGKQAFLVDDPRTYRSDLSPADYIVAVSGDDDIKVSTVFIGVDTADRGKPFESLVFGGPLDEYEEHYATWEEAEEGHVSLLRRIAQLCIEDPEWRHKSFDELTTILDAKKVFEERERKFMEEQKRAHPTDEERTGSDGMFDT